MYIRHERTPHLIGNNFNAPQMCYYLQLEKETESSGLI